MVGNVVRWNEGVKVQDLLRNNFLPGLSEGNSSDGWDRIVNSLPVV